MAKRIVIIGDVPQSQDRAEFLASLAVEQPDIDWEWIKCNTAAFNLPPKPFNQLLAQLRSAPENTEIIIVKLYCLNGREENQLFRACSEPILPPVDIHSIDGLRAWLFSDEAALIKEPPWREPLRIGAMLAILGKLLRNKSWNGSKQGHAWTREADLLGQSPVNRPDGQLYQEACELLSRLEAQILLTKGGKQGKTKKEWSIQLSKLADIKQAVLRRSTQPLRDSDDWTAIFEYLDEGPDVLILVDDELINETARFNCRELR